MNADKPKKITSGSAHHESRRSVSPKLRGLKDAPTSRAISTSSQILPKKWPYYSHRRKGLARHKRPKVEEIRGSFGLVCGAGQPAGALGAGGVALEAWLKPIRPIYFRRVLAPPFF